MKFNRSLVIAALALVSYKATADSYSFHIGAKDNDIAAFSFQRSCISNALPNVPEGTIVQIWDVTNQNYIGSEYDSVFGGWNPLLYLNPGDGFWIENSTSSNIVVTVYGTPLTNSTYTVTLPDTNKWYLVGSAYPLNLDTNNYLECMGTEYAPYWPYSTNCIYTTNSLNYWAHPGDVISFWDQWSQSWLTYTRTLDTNWVPEWSGLPQHTSPRIVVDWSVNWTNVAGKGFFLKPFGGSNAWTHLKATGGSRPRCP